MSPKCAKCSFKAGTFFYPADQYCTVTGAIKSVLHYLVLHTAGKKTQVARVSYWKALGNKNIVSLAGPWLMTIGFDGRNKVNIVIHIFTYVI